MEPPPSGLKRLLARRGVVPLGSWLMSTSAVVSEAMGLVGFDFVAVASDTTILLTCAQMYLDELRAGAVATRDGPV